MVNFLFSLVVWGFILSGDDMEIRKRIEPDFSVYSGKKTELDHLYKLAANFYYFYPEIIYCDDIQDFFIYSEGKYERLSEEQIIRLMRRHPDLSATLKLDIVKCRKIVQNLKTLPEGRYCQYDDFNQEHLINFKNCFYNIAKDEIIPHSEQILSTVQLPYEYDANARCDKFIEALTDITEGDKQKMQVLQEFFGYCFFRDCRLEKAMILLGESRTGKSVILESLEAMIGHENKTSVGLDNFNNPNHCNTFINKYVNIATEIPQNVSNYEDEFKKISSGEPIMIKQMRKDVFNFRPHVKLIFATNNMPRISDTSKAIYQRLIILELDRYFKPEERNVHLKSYIKNNECAGLFNWAMEGYRRLRENNVFSECDASEVFIKEIEKDNNPIRQFAEERIVVNESETITHDLCFEEYLRWCNKNNVKYSYKKNKFNREFLRVFNGITKKGCRKSIDGIQQYVWPNLKLKNHIDDFMYKTDIEWTE